jgi:hypothetical protein
MDSRDVTTVLAGSSTDYSDTGWWLGRSHGRHKAQNAVSRIDPRAAGPDRLPEAGLTALATSAFSARSNQVALTSFLASDNLNAFRHLTRLLEGRALIVEDQRRRSQAFEFLASRDQDLLQFRVRPQQAADLLPARRAQRNQGSHGGSAQILLPRRHASVKSASTSVKSGAGELRARAR